jgi:hypothetical protein
LWILAVETLHSRILDGAVHALDLPVGPRTLGLGKAMIDIVAGAGQFKSMAAEWLLPFDHALDIGGAPVLAAWIGEVGAL